MLKTETVIDLKIRNSYTGKLGKSYNNCHSLCNSFLEFLVIFILFCYKYIYICIYFYLQQMLLKKLCYHTFHK